MDNELVMYNEMEIMLYCFHGNPILIYYNMPEINIVILDLIKWLH